MRNYYDLLSVTPDAPPDEIKKAFRREIARYHPDKVQHLGKEFQEMAAGIAADLTEAQRILMDPALRTKYDQELQSWSARTPAASRPVDAPPAAAPVERPYDAPPSSGPGRSGEEPAAPPPPRPTAGIDFVKRATLSKLREAIGDTLGDSEPLTVRDFDLALVTKPKRVLFKKGEEPVCLLMKFVSLVDPQAIANVWPVALRVKPPGTTSCAVLLMGPGMAPARDLAGAVTEQRRRSRGAGPVLVPVDVRDWEALFPPETPAAVRSLIERLKIDKR
ncbi:MAG TPA: J domain-containing protein [Vicinamibacterales bacterium]|nr:J domain-containing protein [Vicinamibacterales bacterium]